MANRTEAFLDERARHPFVRFLLVGVTNTAISYLTFATMLTLVSESQLRGSIAQIVAYSVGILWSFTWNRSWSFRSKGKLAVEARRFVLVQFLCLLLSTMLIGLAVDYLLLNATISWIVVMSMITLLNYGMLKAVVFKEA